MATYTISKIQLPNGDICNIKDTIYSAGNGISLTGTTFSNSGVRAITTGSSNGSLSINTNGTVANVYVKGIENGYLNIHPENTPIIIPFMHNDIAHLLKRGGSATISYDGVTQSNLNLTNCFDGSGSYWSIANVSVNTIIIELTLFKTFNYGNTIYVDFGSAGWRAKSIKIEAMNTNYTNDTWAVKLNTTSNDSGHVTCSGAHTPNGASNTGGGFNKLRFTFSDFNTTSTSGVSFRISQIGVYNYGSLGLRETYMSRGIDDPIFRDITPNDNNTYSLGSSTKKWSNVYATTFTGNLVGNVTGDVSGSAGSVALSGVTGADDLRAIEALSGTSGFLKKTAANTWSLDTNTYLTATSTLDATKLSGTIPTACYTNSRDAGYGKITPANNSTTTTALTGNTTAVQSSTYSENLKLTAANKWIVLAGTNSSTAGSDELKIAHFVPSSITNSGPTANQTGSYSSTFNIPKITIDTAGHITEITSITVSLPDKAHEVEVVRL